MQNTQIYRLLSALLLSSSAFVSCTPAFAISGLFRDVLKVTTPASLPTPTPTPIPALYGAEFQDSQVHQCLNAACGDISGNWSNDRSLMARLIPSPHFENVWKNVLSPAIREALAADHENRIKSYERLQFLLKSKQQAPRQHPAQAVIQMIRITKKHLTDPTALFSDDTRLGFLSMDPEKVRTFLAAIPDPAEREAMRLITQVVNQNLRLATLDPTANKLSWRLKQLYPLTERATALKTDAALKLAQLANLEKQVGSFLGTQTLGSYEVAIMRRALNGRDLDNVESKIYLEAASSLEIVSQTVTGELFQALMKIPYDPQQALEEMNATKALERALNDAKAFDLNERMKAVESGCKAPLATAHNSTLTREQLKTLEESIRTVRGAAKTVARRYAKSNIGDAGVDRLIDDLITFKLPTNPREMITELHFRMHQNSAKTKTFTTRIERGTPDIDSALLILGPSMVSGELGSQQEAESVINLCKQLPSVSISDFALSAMGKISLSWYTASFPAAGRGIIAHEMGHVLSKVFRTAETRQGGQAQTFIDSLNCVANRNPFVMNPVHLTATQDTTWSEEDWADHFSSLVMNELRVSAPKVSVTNFGCSLVNGSSDYTGNKLRPAHKDSHSSGFLRTLMIASDLGQLPAQCQAFVNYAATNRRPLTCQ